MWLECTLSGTSSVEPLVIGLSPPLSVQIIPHCFVQGLSSSVACGPCEFQVLFRDWQMPCQCFLPICGKSSSISVSSPYGTPIICVDCVLAQMILFSLFSFSRIFSDFHIWPLLLLQVHESWTVSTLMLLLSLLFTRH